MIITHHIGTTTVQGPAHDMPRPFDPQAHIPARYSAAGGRCEDFAPEDGREGKAPSRACCSEATGHLQNAKLAPSNADRAQIAALGACPVPAARRSPLEHERDAGQVLDPASEVAWLRKIGINSAADLIEELVEECSREFGRGYEVGRAVGSVDGPRPMTEAEVGELLGIKRGGKA